MRRCVGTKWDEWARRMTGSLCWMALALAGCDHGRYPGADAGAGRKDGGSTQCQTAAPLWEDCDSIEDFAVDSNDSADGSESPPDKLTELDGEEGLRELVREQAAYALSAQYEAYWDALRQTKCQERQVCDNGTQTADGGASLNNATGTSTGTTTGTGTGTGSGSKTVVIDDDDAAEVEPSADGSVDRSSERSGTNNQVAGVDEPDLLKLDDRYVYIVATNELLILDAADPASTTEASRFVLEGTPMRLLVSSDRALVIASTGTDSYYRPCTYAYDCQFWGDGYGTLLLVLDVTDRTEPRLIRRIELSGSFLAGRMIDSYVHIVTADTNGTPILLGTPPPALPASSTDDPEHARAALEDSYDQAQQALESTSVDLALPTVKDEAVAADGTRKPVSTKSTVNSLHTAPGKPQGVLTITSFDLEAIEKLHQDTILSNPGALYAAADRLYVAVPQVGSNYAGYGADATWIHAFDLAQATATYVASGRVEGHVLNQFSMDQLEDHLRIATSTGWVPDPDVYSTVTILKRKSDQLVKTGAVSDLAPQEDIRAVRFMGPRGYVVTFKKTDPLFVLGLSDPAKPKLLGELKIPGFSTYLHPLDDTHLLSIGYDADDQGDFAFFDGVMLQIMDVEDPAKPELLHKEVIGTRGSSSEALTDHLAFNYFAAKNMLAIPMTICEGGGNGMFGDVMTFTGLLVYDVSIEDGFSLHGRVAHPAPSGYYASGYSTTCSSWWTQASSPVKRSAFVEDHVLSLGDAFAKMSPLDNLSEDAASFPVGLVPCADLDEAECSDNSSCAVISGTLVGSDQTGYVGCASVPQGMSYLTCAMTPTCAQEVVTGACALLGFNCVPDGWTALAEAECGTERCTQQGGSE